MKLTMRKCISMILGLCLVFIFVPLQTRANKKKKMDKDTNEWRYEIENSGVGAQGTYLVKVWSYSKKPNLAIEQAKKNAVHGIVFKGFAASAGSPAQKAICTDTNAAEVYADFFKSFFATGGDYSRYVSLADDGAVGAEDCKKVGKEYKIGVVVSVMKDDLRKALEKAGVVKGLSSGF